MPATYEPIATQTLGSSTLTITFSSIPSTYTDLQIVWSTKISGTFNNFVQFNGDTGTNYSWTRLVGNGSTASSAAATSVSNGCYVGIGANSGTPTLMQISVFNYAGSTNKTTLSRYGSDNNGSGASGAAVGLWRNTAAINSITLLNNGSDPQQAGTTVTLYGIKAA